MVVFATPKMLYAGLSLNIFKRWFTDEKNMIIMPGNCVSSGTIGHKIKMSVQFMSFSAHADAKYKGEQSTGVYSFENLNFGPQPKKKPEATFSFWAPE